ncbi:MAG: glycosyltransferase family 4 protein [Anaeromicrobium sp.]|uniref:glycosyltransferase family 4 protein n=1 Tax=Anaeromicrobium sp. TaxID=1929132 RepID=UPI0025DE12B7|nr:glycosyltransferase family 4 protein [Anaeromicrobium sp.]MCT4595034.1 glycosyltransferase family 4 protein [Anaeromicrobium sp.]
MRILFQIRKDYKKNPAGDAVIFNNMVKGLRKLNVSVDVYNDHRISVKKYDVVHIFNTIRVYESYKFFKNAENSGKRIVVTPIYWNLRDFYKKSNNMELVRIWESNESKRKEMLDKCDIILVHAQRELDEIEKFYGKKTNYKILPYGVDNKYINGKKNYLSNKYNIDNYILCVGRIHKQKNQISLLEALKKETIPIVIAGDINDKEYLKTCLKIRNKNVFILNDKSKYELPSLYKSAKVHVLPSFFEYPGLASMEAGLAGCNVVTTQIGTTKEIFKDYAKYCNPYDVNSIKENIMEAFWEERDSKLREDIYENNNWEKICLKLKNIYRSLI